MAENRTIEERVIALIKKYPNKKASELYKIAPFNTDYSYFSHKYNAYKNRKIPKTREGLYKEFPQVVDWITANYSKTDKSMQDIAEMFDITKREVRLIKKTFHLIKKYSQTTEYVRDYEPEIPEKASLNLVVGDTIRVTKYHPVDLRDIVTLGRWEVIHKNEHCISLKDPSGWVHGFPVRLFNNYLEYEETSS